MKINIDFKEKGLQKNNIHLMAEAVVRFLIRNGVNKISAPDYVTIVNDNTISLKPTCANSEYTRGIALLQLVSSIRKSPFYTHYGIHGMHLCFTQSLLGNEYITVRDYLDNCIINIKYD